ncbi:hypothetical protein [Dickeya zeae]|nr:hypothetical protein [Dickeya zeae]
MKKIIFSMMISLSISQFANAISLKGEYPVCTSKNAFERLSAMAAHNDVESIERILKTDCFMPASGMKVDQVVSRESGGVTQIKIYHKGNLYDLWTSKYNLSAK